MPTNVYFNTGTTAEQRLYENLIIEQLSVFGQDVYYLPRKLDPTVHTDVYNDLFLKKYATALIKKQWGANLIKFNGVTMLGGVQMNGETIYTQADEEIKLLEEQLLNGYGLPADMMIG